MNIEDVKPDMKVKYVPKHVNGDSNHPDCRLGEVHSVSDKFVFVRYKGSSQVKATNPEDLVPA